MTTQTQVIVVGVATVDGWDVATLGNTGELPQGWAVRASLLAQGAFSGEPPEPEPGPWDHEEVDEAQSEYTDWRQ